MYPTLTIAIIMIYICIAIILVGLVVLFSIKIYSMRKEKLEKYYLNKNKEYFKYILINIDSQIGLMAPPVFINNFEMKVIQRKLVEWIEDFKGKSRENLIGLCEELGLITKELERLKYPITSIKVDAAYYLGGMRSEKAVPIMIEFLKSVKYSSVTFIIARAVAKCVKNPEDLKELTKIMVSFRKGFHDLIADIIMESEVDYVPIFNDFLEDSDPDLIKVALIVLSHHTKPKVNQTIVKLVDSEEKELRIKAVKVLTRSNKFLEVHHLTKWLHNEDWEIRSVIVKSLGNMGDKRAIPYLKMSLADSSWWVRYNSAKSLLLLGEGGFTALCEAAIENDDPFKSDMAQDVLHEEITKGIVNEKDIQEIIKYNNRRKIYESYFKTIAM